MPLVRIELVEGRTDHDRDQIVTGLGFRSFGAGRAQFLEGDL